MDVCVPCNTSACLDISSIIESAAVPHNSIPYCPGEISIDDLEICLTKLGIIEDCEILTSGCKLSTRENDDDNGAREYKCCDLDKITLNDSTSDKCLNKRTSFPPPGFKSSEHGLLTYEGNSEDIIAEASELNASTKSSNQCFPQALSLPIPVKLVSAMKGSREKHGTPPKKLSVSWAPEVYDPIPTSVSHVPSNKNYRNLSYGKKSGKHKQRSRGKSSQSSKGKEKKQGRKTGKSVGKFIPFHEAGGLGSFGEPRVSNVEFEVGIPDLFCGSSFLKTSVAKSHFAVA